MYSGCGGGYLYVVSEQPVPGSARSRCGPDRRFRGRANAGVYVRQFRQSPVPDVRLFQEASRLGPVTRASRRTRWVRGDGPSVPFSQAERRYFRGALR